MVAVGAVVAVALGVAVAGGSVGPGAALGVLAGAVGSVVVGSVRVTAGADA
jgi:hypothetical protein